MGEYPVEVFAHGEAFIPEIKEMEDYDTVACVLKFASGAIGTIDISRNAVYGYDQRLEVCFIYLGVAKLLSYSFLFLMPF